MTKYFLNTFYFLVQLFGLLLRLGGGWWHKTAYLVIITIIPSIICMFSFFKLNVDYHNRNFGLDLLRALAIIPVIMWHGEPYLSKAGTNFPWIPIYNGIEMFFVLSGFLIGGILLKTFTATTIFDIDTIKKFYTRRWLRTLPNYYLILVINLSLTYCGITQDFTKFNYKFLFFLQNFAQSFQGFFWESWSLSVEEWFYLLFPLVLFFLYKILPNKNRKIVFLLTVMCVLLIPSLLRIEAATRIHTPTIFDLDIYFLHLVIYRLDSIGIGVLGAWLYHYYPIEWKKYRYIGLVPHSAPNYSKR